MKHYFLIFAIIICNSCKSRISPVTNSKCTQDLTTFINDYWHHDSTGAIVYINESLISFVSGKHPENKCLNGLNKNQIISLFGIPDKINKNSNRNSIGYYTNSNCFSSNSSYCTYIYFDFDKENIYDNIGLRGWTKNN